MARLGVRIEHVDRLVCKAPLRPGEYLAGQRAAERRAEEARNRERAAEVPAEKDCR
jgi:hypothetical protein